MHHIRRLPVFIALVSALSAACGGFGCGVEREAAQTAEAPAAPNPPPAPAPPERDDDAGTPRIVCLGDSLTAGYGLLETQAYPTLLQKRVDADGYKFEVVNAGVSGDTTAGGLRRLDWALEGNVRVLVVALGGNDALRGLSVSDMKANLAAILERARERNVLVILAGMQAPPNYGEEYAAAFQRTYRELALQYRVLFLPFLLEKVAGHAALNQSDGIHPNARGAEIVADNVWAVLRPVLDQMSS